MKAFTKYIAGAAVATAMTVSAASPAQAQIFGRDPYGRNGGGVGDIITGVAVLGGIGAILSALGRDGSRYGNGYGYNDRYRDDYRNAVNACASEAQRRGGQVNVTEVERRGYDSYRVRGVIEAGYGNYNRNGSYGGYGNYDPRYGDQYGRYDPRYDNRYDTRYDRYGRNDAYGRYDQRVAFACTARADGRISDFDTDRL